MKKHKEKNSCANALKYALLLIGTLMFLWTGTAQATDYTVDCGTHTDPDNSLFTTTILASGNSVHINETACWIGL